MVGTGLLAVAAYLTVMTPGINTVFEMLMTGGILALWLAAIYTVYRLAKWGYRSVRSEPMQKS